MIMIFFLRVLSRYEEKHRYFHTLEHLDDILDRIEPTIENIIVALYHDIVYNPHNSDNEERSVEIFLEDFKLFDNEFKVLLNVDLIKQMILDTKNLNYRNKFNQIDRRILNEKFPVLLEYHEKIWKEYSFLDWEVFKKGHLEIFKQLSQSDDRDEYIKYVENRKIRLGLYAGSFNPFHIGHNDIVEKSFRIFDKVVIANGINPDKKDRDENEGIVIKRDHSSSHERCEFNCLLSDLVKHYENENYDVTLIYGLRNGRDFDYVFDQYRFLEELKEDIKVVYLPTNPKYSHISSSMIRGLEKFNKIEAEKYKVVI